MRTLTKILMVAALALIVSSAANANVVITLTQIGGTYSATVGAQAGDTLILDVGYTITGADTHHHHRPGGRVRRPRLRAFVSGSETGLALWSAGATAFNALGAPAVFIGELHGPGVDLRRRAREGGRHLCGRQCAVHLRCSAPARDADVQPHGRERRDRRGSGASAAAVRHDDPDGLGAVSVTPLATLGTFTIIPEPTTASLLGLGLLGLTVAGRRRN